MKIIFKKSFEKQRNKLPRKIALRFDERLRVFLQNNFDPILDNHSIDPAYPGWRSINVTGDYRAFFEPIGTDTIVFMKIGTHSQLYK